MKKRRRREDLRKYQLWMAAKVFSRKRVMLAAEPGLGKTISALTAVKVLLARQMVSRVLIVAPLLVAETVWPEEVDEWAHTCLLRVSVITGTPKQREAAARSKAQIHVVNRENLRWLLKFWGGHWPYDMLIYDEASRLRSGREETRPAVRKDGSKGAARWSDFAWLRAWSKWIERIVLLTGTPAPRGLQDLWGPITILDGGERLGRTRTEFLNRWFIPDYNRWKWEPREGAHDEITERVSDLMFGLKSEDYISLPPVIPKIISVKFPPKLRAQYNEFKRTLVAEEYDVEAINNGVLTNKLLQFCNGSLYDEDGNDIFVHDLKVKALRSLVEEACGAPLLVGYGYKFDRAAILNEFRSARAIDKNPAVISQWNSGKLPMLVGHPASMGHGLNLQSGGNMMVWFGLTWDLELYEQFNKRLHRSGQRARQVYRYHIIVENTIEDAIMRVLGTRGRTQERIMDAVKAHLGGGLNRC